MYLSNIDLSTWKKSDNPLKEVKILSDNYVAKQMLYKVMDEVPRFRLEPDHERILILTENIPDWSRLDFGQLEGVKRLNLDFHSGQQVVISSVLNPAWRDKETGKIICANNIPELKIWLLKKFLNYGIALRPDMLVVHYYDRGFVIHKKPSYKIAVASIKAQGAITNPERFRELLSEGVGRSKHAGFGLVIAKPL